MAMLKRRSQATYTQIAVAGTLAGVAVVLVLLWLLPHEWFWLRH